MANHQEEKPVVVVMVPLPAQGHLNQLLHFSRLVSTRAGLHVHYIGSATHNRQAKERIQGWDPLTIPNIHFHDFSLPSVPTPPPDPKLINKWPFHLQPTFEAATHLRDPLSKLLLTLSFTSKRVIVIHDSLMLFAAQEAASSIVNGEAYCFNSCSVFCVLNYKWEGLGRPTNEKTSLLDKLTQISADSLSIDSFKKFVYDQLEFKKFDSGELYNTSNAIEGPFIDMLDQEPFNETIDKWIVGPFNPITLNSTQNSNSNSKPRSECLQWLDKHPEKSVLYVSFGTMTSISDEQIMELAVGLENSGQRFIWVLRDADRGDIFAGEDEVRRMELPEGYEERLKDRGMVVRGYAPQLEILAHKSTGGFMSHCGWNSCMESLSLGIPIAAWAMHSDQPWNSVLITEFLKVGLCVREWAKKEELVKRIDIESVVSKLMDSDEGKEIRKRAEELGVRVREGMMEGGNSIHQLDSFFKHITRDY